MLKNLSRLALSTLIVGATTGLYANQNSLFSQLYSETSRIVGGHDAEEGAYPFIVGLVQRGANAERGHFCGGSLIHPEWVLTAAHCVTGLPWGDRIDIIAGMHKLVENGQTKRVAAGKIIPHKDYNPDKDMNNDIALIKLSEPITSFNAVNLVKSGSKIDEEPNTARVIGWGNIRGNDIGEDNGFERPSVLQEVDLPFVNRNACNQAILDKLAVANGGKPGDYNGYDFISEANMLCAGLKSGGKDSCQGDSGGPLFASENGKYTQVGVVSFGLGCAAENSYGVYARVQTYNPWIDEIIANN